MGRKGVRKAVVRGCYEKRKVPRRRRSWLKLEVA